MHARERSALPGACRWGRVVRRRRQKPKPGEPTTGIRASPRAWTALFESHGVKCVPIPAPARTAPPAERFVKTGGTSAWITSSSSANGSCDTCSRSSLGTTGPSDSIRGPVAESSDPRHRRAMATRPRPNRTPVAPRRTAQVLSPDGRMTSTASFRTRDRSPRVPSKRFSCSPPARRTFFAGAMAVLAELALVPHHYYYYRAATRSVAKRLHGRVQSDHLGRVVAFAAVTPTRERRCQRGRDHGDQGHQDGGSSAIPSPKVRCVALRYRRSKRITPHPRERSHARRA